VAHFDRRSLLKAGLVAGAALPFGLLDTRSSRRPRPVLAIAHYKSSPNDPDGIAEEAKRLTRSSIDVLGGMGRFVSRGDTVWVKPNIGWDRRPEQAATTNPFVVAALIEMCYQAGAKKVYVSDNPSNEARNTFPRSGIQQAAEKAGAEVFFLDERKFRKMAINGKALKEWVVYQDVVDCDRFINVPIVKTHNLSKATMGMKNLMGVTGGSRNRFHQDIDNSLVDLAVFLKPQLTVLDAIRVLTANGPTGGNLADVKRRDTLVAGVDQVPVDAVGATLLGYKPEEIGYLVQGHARGLGTIDFKSLSPGRLEV
jgi:uncharacterized protein (DUF362 family)